ncbi:hypothetical protein CEXT_624341 [Caerostris extrusa]|uniref:Uncharacterized protein n=1 Tax=Caerostris extrusa TaxID=172846 RepID=A0AAV4TEB3_CAEEX|nr:hypothetical protein CEXT_624341 [Caerostris extrusa]
MTSVKNWINISLMVLQKMRITICFIWCFNSEDEDKHLSIGQTTQVNNLLESFRICFIQQGKKIPKIQHNSNTGNNLPVSLPPHHMTSVKKELDILLIYGITE